MAIERTVRTERTEGAERPERDPAPAVTRAMRALDLLAAASGRPMTLSEIARGLHAAKSSTLNVCLALEAGRLVQRRDGGYVLGRRTLELGGAYLGAFDQVREFYRLCAESAVLSHELVQIAVLDGTDVLYLARHEGRAPLRLSARIGDRFPAAPTAVGNALLSLLDDDEIARRYRDERGFPRMTERSPRSLEQLRARLLRVREVGYALDEGGVNAAVVGIAVAVPPRVAADSAFAVGVSLFGVDSGDEVRGTIAGALVDLADQLGTPLGPDPDSAG